jgi:hypothetical protein
MGNIYSFLCCIDKNKPILELSPYFMMNHKNPTRIYPTIINSHHVHPTIIYPSHCEVMVEEVPISN